MFTIEKIEGTTVTVMLDKFSKRLQLPNAPVDDKDALLQFCSDRERAYDESRAQTSPKDVTALVGKTQATLPAKVEPVVDESTTE